MYFNIIAFLPFPVNTKISVTKGSYCLCPVNHNTESGFPVVCVRIKISGDRPVFHPSWNAYLKGYVFACGFVYGNLNIAVPGVISLLAQGHFFTADFGCCRIGHEKVNKETVVFYGIDVSGQRGYKPTDIGGAAGTTEPWLTLMLTYGFQRIGIEEASAVQ